MLSSNVSYIAASIIHTKSGNWKNQTFQCRRFQFADHDKAPEQWRLVPMGCRAAAPPRVYAICIYRIFYKDNIFCDVIVHTFFLPMDQFMSLKRRIFLYC